MKTLIAFAGLPGTGKSTIAKALSVRTGAVYLRVDEIETIMLSHDPERDIGSQGYEILAALAASNLALGHDVITDCVNPWTLTRGMFAETAARANARFLGVEIICSDPGIHRLRVEHRAVDIPGCKKPSWQEVTNRDYAVWSDADIRIDTASKSVADSASEIASRL
ncbi:AAA family ATPase [Martelella limonii]|uniref:AAA family ATPase n=1 Tax=Martelella limonii TaxID=1647649 RepID=UPI00157FBE7F|nr:AAA family ATPase [Martelella limonii]